jgi:formamidopyrimidine-DNA glycosylase
MTGNLFLKLPGDPPDAHLHLAVTMDDGRQLRLCDHRGFGELRVVTPNELAMLSARLGPEPLGPDFTTVYLAGQLGRRAALVKALLLNQAIVAGLGNIYVDEALWAAQVHPERRANTLCPMEIEALHDAIVRLVSESVERRGTTFSDYKDLYGKPGGNAVHLQVFHQIKKPCPRCGAPIEMIRAAGRGSSVCLTCQVAPTASESTRPTSR